jgi:membrane fusion protein (multidrug efflux system)
MAIQESSQSGFKNRRGVYTIGVALFLIVVGLFAWWRVYVYPFQSTDDASIEGAEIVASSVLAGQILEIKVDEGDLVQAGDVLFVLDDSLLQIERQKAVAALGHAEDEAALQQIRRDLAKDDFNRARIEFKGGVIPEEAMTRVAKNFEMAGAQLQSILSLVEVQQAELDSIDLQLELCQVKALSPGVVAKRWHNPGDVVRAGQTVLSLVDLNQIWVSANVEETQLASIRVGDRAEISVDAYPDFKFHGNVLVVGAAAASQFALIPPNNSSGNFTKVTQRIPLKISFKASDEGRALYLRPGMSVEVKIRAK